jgi:ABC transporter substrate binding protein
MLNGVLRILIRSRPRIFRPSADRLQSHSDSRRLTIANAICFCGAVPACEGSDAIRSNKTARVRHAARRRGRMAALGARAAAGEAADHRLLGRSHAFSLEPLDRRFRAAAARTRLERGADYRNRISLGGGTQRALYRVRGRVRPAQGGCDCHGGTVVAAKQATSVIPIVFAIAVDPLGTGLVANLARPGGNVTGLSLQHTDLAGKRLELLREVLPGLRRLAIMGNVDYPAAVLEADAVQAAARTLGLEVDLLEIRRAEDIGPIFATLKSDVQALYVCGDALINANRARINTLALGARLLTTHPDRAYLESGGLMSYGANNTDLFRRAGNYVDKILRGAKPATFRSSSRPSSSWSSTSRPRRRLASKSRRCSPALHRAHRRRSGLTASLLIGNSCLG